MRGLVYNAFIPGAAAGSGKGIQTFLKEHRPSAGIPFPVRYADRSGMTSGG